MKNRSNWSCAAALPLALAASCNPPANKAEPPVNEGSAANMAAPAGNMAGSVEQEKQSRSILRPDIAVPTPTPSRVAPVHAVISFGASAFTLDETARAALDALLDEPATKGGGAIVLRGHSDSRGSDGDNRAASRARAETVRDYLVEKGVSPERITLIALGETRPVAPNAALDGSDDPEGRARNRRVDVDIAGPEIAADAETTGPATPD